MIRRFFSMMIFTATILTASFGQNIFGRQDIINWLHIVQQQAPRHAGQALAKTDVFLSHLAPSAGVELPDRCVADGALMG
jgi:hypothetical protein